MPPFITFAFVRPFDVDTCRIDRAIVEAENTFIDIFAPNALVSMRALWWGRNVDRLGEGMFHVPCWTWNLDGVQQSQFLGQGFN